MTATPPDHPRSKGGSARGRQVSARRVRDLISASIRDGYIAPDAPLAEEDLMELFDTSRGSVRAALTQLSETGFVERRRRVGTRVTHLGVVIPLTDILTDSEHVYLETLEQRVVPNFPLVRERLRIQDPTVRLIETRFVCDDETLGLRTAYFSTRYDSHPDFLSGPASMASVLHDFFGATPGEVLVSIGSDAADVHTARVLGISENAPLISREMTYYDVDGEPIQTVFDRFRGDRVRLETVASAM
ncbi:GntR family transcriptional regulator [Frondihabitans sp. 4ASC-45]|uniref:GntR family transcriptional regulator n=1 Tax=Frondihabitans sp. 4ASC-45 TaxID=3111636 RepID=UPI003C17AD30